MFSSAPPAPADAFARLIEGLRRAIAARSPANPLAWPLLLLAWSRLRRMATRFARLAIRCRAGKLAIRRSAPRRPPAPPRPPPRRLPNGFGWLVRLVPEAAASASQLQHLLGEPEMAALIAAAPQAGRILRALCRLLGVRPPPGLRPPPRPRAPAAPPDPAGPADPAAPSTDSTEGPALPAASRPVKRPWRGRSAVGWVPRSRLFAWRPPVPD